MIIYRADVWLTGLKPEMVPVQIALLDIAQTERAVMPHYLEITISGAMEGDHSLKSKHWSGLALDCFCMPWNDSTKQKLVTELKKRLPERLYDIVLEATHVHIEFDPKLDKVTVT